MNNRSRVTSNSQDDYPSNILRVAAYGAAINGVMLGVSAGVAFNFLQLLFRRSGGSFHPLRFLSRPLALGTAFGATGYVVNYTGSAALTFFVKRRADEQMKQMRANNHHDDDELQTSRVNQHN